MIGVLIKGAFGLQCVQKEEDVKTHREIAI